MTVKAVVVGVLGTVLKVLDKRLEKLEIIGRIQTIQTTALLRSLEELEMVTKELERRLELLEIEGKIEITALLRSARTLRTFLETLGDLLLLRVQ